MIRAIKSALRKATGGVEFRVGYRPDASGKAVADERRWAEDADLYDDHDLADVLNDLRKGGIFDIYCYSERELLTNATLVIVDGKVADCYDSVGASGMRRDAEWRARLG